MPPSLNKDIYGYDPTSTAEGISSRILGIPAPTLDINGEKDSRAVSEGNHGTQGGGRSGQGDPSRSPDTGTPAKDGGPGDVISSSDSQ
jgi:hypothetical protein